MSDLLRLPLTEVTALLARREVSPVELMQATLDRIGAGNGKLNAFVAMRDRDALLADARSAEARIQRGDFGERKTQQITHEGSPEAGRVYHRRP